jgi:3-mercaptopyruvate sulfurtransferase SseA/sterol desaturase/sphingolipid hydroxylase (fatty acid hydroxylase superfamily)
MHYFAWLIGLSAVVALLEVLWPARDQPALRRWSWSDALHLVFNGHFLGVLLYGIATYRVLPPIDAWLADQGWLGLLYRDIAGGWPLFAQILVALVVIDFVQWGVHNLLHRVGFLWRIHQVHHSVKDGEMDWIVSFRFSWLEPVIYKSITYIPLMWFGFAPEAIFVHAVFGTLIGHLNHANLNWDYGWLKYVLNSPKMHLYHHDYAAPKTGQNFGIIFSCWDWIFGTAHLPDHPPARIGFPGVEKVPEDFFGQLSWPLGLAVPALQRTHVLNSVMGIGVVAMLYAASQPPKAPTPMFGEPSASSQPAARPDSTVRHAASPEEATAALARFGNEAREAGWALPEVAVSPQELAEALSSPRLVVLDVRKADRFAAGHIPSAQLVERSDYSGGAIPGVSLDRAALEGLLRSRGVNRGDTVVVMGDGGPEPYRLWWTLREVGGLDVRVLDGGLQGWKALGERLAEGPGLTVEPGDVELPGGAGDNLLWSDVLALQVDHPDLQLVDTRSEAEFEGAETHRNAARAGHIPGAVHLDWTDALTLDETTGVPKLKTADAFLSTLRDAGIDPEKPILTYCQSGTRSSATYYAALQAGLSEDRIWNYDGSWAEYSRLAELPVAIFTPTGRAQP